MRRTYEKPQKGNPHKLTIYQHVWPRASIARFTKNGTVDLFDRARGITRRAKPGDKIFCAKRVWDEKAERGHKKWTEDPFQKLVSEIVLGRITTIDPERKKVIDAFFALWRVRASYKWAEDGEISFNGITGSNLTKDQEECLETNGCMFVRAGGTMPARMMNAIRMQREIDGYMGDLSTIRWEIIRSQGGHFVVPSFPTLSIIPLTPALCLCSPGPSGTISDQNLAAINKSIRSVSGEYFFAQDLGQCP